MWIIYDSTKNCNLRDFYTLQEWPWMLTDLAGTENAFKSHVKGEQLLETQSMVQI